MGLRNQINAARIRFNDLIYRSRSMAGKISRVLAVFSALTAFILIFYLFGFEPGEYERTVVTRWIEAIFIVFLVNFALRWVYTSDRRKYVKTRPFEALLMFIIFIELMSEVFFGYQLIEDLFVNLGFLNFQAVYRGTVAIYMLVILLMEFTKVSVLISKLHLQPSTLFIGSFILLIGFGTGLLMLPAMTVRGGMSFLDALFTSVSACCVTGLAVVDTATFFTVKGQVVILFLIQVGGLGIISFATFFANVISSGVGLRHQSIVQDMLSGENLLNTRKLLRRIVNITLLIELACFIGIYFTWENVTFDSTGQRVFYSIFHAVSAFCNAGFSLFSEGIYTQGLHMAYLLHLVLMFAVIMGGLGFSTIQDLFSPKALRERMEKPWIDWKLGTKIAVFTSILLLGVGTLGFFLLEKETTLADKSFGEQLITAFFQSGSARTAGFNTIDIGAMTVPSLILMMFLMFVGASSGSVGGGIKTSTFYLVIASAFNTIRGYHRVEVGRRLIPNPVVFKALSIFLFAFLINILAIFLLSISEPGIPILSLAFEQVSAFGTVGLSTGITADLNALSHTILIFSMFLGRVGPLTFALMLSTEAVSKSYRYPAAHVMVG